MGAPASGRGVHVEAPGRILEDLDQAEAAACADSCLVQGGQRAFARRAQEMAPAGQQPALGRWRGGEGSLPAPSEGAHCAGRERCRAQDRRAADRLATGPQGSARQGRKPGPKPAHRRPACGRCPGGRPAGRRVPGMRRLRRQWKGEVSYATWPVIYGGPGGSVDLPRVLGRLLPYPQDPVNRRKVGGGHLPAVRRKPHEERTHGAP
jgi:hypothetical protein